MYSSPTVADGMVFFGIDDRKLYCLAEDNGNKLGDFYIPSIGWAHPIATLTPATVADGKVFFQAFREAEVVPGVVRGKSHIFCLDEYGLTKKWESYPGNWKDTDTLLWGYPLKNIRFQSSPAVADGKVFFGTWNDHIYCFDTDRGLIWDYSANGRVVSSPAVADGMVFFGSCYHSSFLNMFTSPLTVYYFSILSTLLLW